MSSFVASLIILGVFLAGAGICVWSFARRRGSKAIVAGAALLFAGLGVAHTGGMERADARWFAGQPMNDTEAAAQSCERAFDLLKENGLITVAGEGRVEIRRSLWNKIPEQSRQMLTQCIETMASEEGGDVELVEVDG